MRRMLQLPRAVHAGKRWLVFVVLPELRLKGAFLSGRAADIDLAASPVSARPCVFFIQTEHAIEHTSPIAQVTAPRFFLGDGWRRVLWERLEQRRVFDRVDLLVFLLHDAFVVA